MSVQEDRFTMGYKRILVTLDGSKFSERALKHVMRIAEPGAYIHLLSVKAESPTSELVAMAKAVQGDSTATGWPLIPPVTEPRDPHARDQYLAQVEDWLSQAEYHVSTETREGEIISSILSVAQGGYDVIVMVTHNRSGMNKTVLGSVTEAVLEQAPCAVLAIPADAL